MGQSKPGSKSLPNLTKTSIRNAYFLDFPFRGIFKCKNSAHLPFISLSHGNTDNKNKWVIIEAMQKVFRRSIRSIRMILKYAGPKDPDLGFFIHASTQNRSEFFPIHSAAYRWLLTILFPRKCQLLLRHRHKPSTSKGLQKETKIFLCKTM